MKTVSIVARRPVWALLAPIVFASLLPAQQAPAAKKEKDDEETVTMSKFVVDTKRDRGYGSGYALGATRVNIPLIESPLSALTINRALLDDVAPVDVTDALKYTSSISYAGNGTNGQVNVRGSSMRLDYQDGLPVNTVGPIHIWDMDFFERIEVVKGPAGTLYGAHQLGGLLNRVIKRPLTVQRTTVTAMYDSIGPLNGVYKGSVDNTGPVLGSSRLFQRVVGLWQDGSTRSGGPDDRKGVSLAFDYHLEKNSKVWVNFLNYFSNGAHSGQWQVDAGNNISYMLGPEFSVFENPEDTPALLKNRTWLYEAGYETSLNIFGIDWSARLVGRTDNGNHDRQEGLSTTALQFYNAAGTLIGSGTPAGIFVNPNVASIRTSANSVRTWRHRGDMSGVFFDVTGDLRTGPFRHKLISYVQTVNRKENRWIVDSLTATNEAGSTGPFELWPKGLPKVTFSKTIRLAPVGAISDYSKSTAFNFGVQDNVWFWKDKIVAVAGARYDWAENDSINRVTNAAFLGQNFSQWVFKYGLVGRVTEGLSIYLNHSENFNPVVGGFDDLGNRLKNEEGKNDEGGLKFDLMDHRLTATISVFDSKTTNKLVSIGIINPSTNNLEVYRIQTGHTTTKGWEADIAWQPIDSLSLIGGLGDVQIRNENGIRLANGSYGMNYRGFAKYTFHQGPVKGLGIGVGYSFTNDRAGDAGDTFTLPAYGSMDGLIQYGRRKWSVQVNILNATDKIAVVSSVVRANVQPLAPRQYRVTFRYTF